MLENYTKNDNLKLFGYSNETLINDNEEESYYQLLYELYKIQTCNNFYKKEVLKLCEFVIDLIYNYLYFKNHKIFNQTIPEIILYEISVGKLKYYVSSNNLKNMFQYYITQDSIMKF